MTHSLSITTFHYRPANLQDAGAETELYLNRLNRELLTRLQASGEAYISNAIVGEKFLLRACIVNLRTASADVEELPLIAARIGRTIDQEWRPQAF